MKNNICLLAAIMAITCFTNCKKDAKKVSNQDFFLPVNVDFYVNLDLPLNSDLNFPNGFIYQPGYGYKNRGVIVYNTGFTGPDQYVAFDRSCPYKVDSSCSFVSVESSALYFRCGQYTGSGRSTLTPCCNSRFVAGNGTQVSGPADRSLKQYYVGILGRQLRITNLPQ